MTHDETGKVSEEELVRMLREAPEGDYRAFEELVRRHQRGIIANCHYLTHDTNNSEDLAQEVFVKAFFGVRQFEGRSTVRHWLQRIKVNHCLNHMKKRDRAGLVPIEDDAAETAGQLRVAPTAEGELDAEAGRKRIAAILDAMPETLRVPLVLCDMDDLSYDEIASTLGIGLSAVKMRIKRAREHFRRLYEEGEQP